MNSTTTHPAGAPSRPRRPLRDRSPPWRNFAWTAVPDVRVVLNDVDWTFYERLVDSIPEGANLHADFDGKDVEIMSLSPIHDVIKKTLARFVELTAEELEIPCTGMGRRPGSVPEVLRAWRRTLLLFAAEKLAVADEAIVRWSKVVAEYPNPDLAIEVDISPSKIDRPSIYAASASPRSGGSTAMAGGSSSRIWARTGPTGPSTRVDILPVRAQEIGRWVLDEDRRAGAEPGGPAPRLGPGRVGPPRPR